MKLYVHPISGHCHRVQLFFGLAGVDHTLVHVDLLRGEQKQPAFLALNPFGQVPVLDDDGVVIADSNAILVYVALKRGLSAWYPTAPAEAAEVQRWLSIAAGQLAYGPSMARRMNLFKITQGQEDAIQRAHQLYSLLDPLLEARTWLAGGAHPTLADVALYSYTDRAAEGSVDLAAYPHVRAWLRRVEALPGFIPFPPQAVGLQA